MKLTFLFLVVGLMQLSASVYSQSTKLSLEMRDAKVAEVLDAIEKQSEFRFAYSPGFIDLNREVTVDIREKTIDESLKVVFAGTNVEFGVFDRHILLYPESLSPGAETVVSHATGAQQRTISGKVTDSGGQPLPGVTVVVKGTTQGTVTNANGNYSLSNIPDDATLVFSFIGLRTQEVAVGTQNVINVLLQEETFGIDEVVAIGYGTVKKSDLTGSVSSVSNEDFNKGVNSSVDQAIMGKVAGVQIRQTSAEPGGGVSIRIRGASSINAGNEPLYVIDGLPIDNSPLISTGGGAGTDANPNPKNPLSSLNPNNIESIEILKDASATAIYGSRGANGVILVTTKTGKTGKSKIDFDYYSGVQNLAQKYNILNAREYMDAINAISDDRGDSPVFSQEDMSTVGNGTDWQDEVTRTGSVQNYNLTFSGGAQDVNYYISTNYFNHQGIIKNSGMERYALKTNLTGKISERFNLTLNMNASLVDDDAAVTGETHNENAGVIYAAVFYDPTLPVKDANGNYTDSDLLLLPNPATIYAGIDNNIQTIRIFGNIAMNYQITDELSTKLNFGTDIQNARRDIYNSKITFQGKGNNGLAFINSVNRSNVLAEYTLNYLKTINEDHVITALLGITYQDFINRGYSSSISDFPTDILKTNNLSFGNGDYASVNSFKAGNSLLSYIGRVNYNLYNKFLITGSIRADGSSRFGENNKFGYFPSFAFAWKLQEEKFIPELFNELKLRTSWGITGNQDIANYTSLSTYTSIGSAIFNEGQSTATGPSRLANPNLKWESTDQLNVGIDAGILGGRISGSIDYFIKNTWDMLIYLPLPRSSGYGGQLINIGKMRNTGFEAMLQSRNIVKKDFNWNTTINFSTIKNEVLDIGGLDYIIDGETIIKESKRIFI